MKSPLRFFAAIGLLVFVGTIQQVRAQFTFATDNASNYGTWSGNGGSGFNAWSFSNGSNSGQFIGNPSNNGMGTTGIGTTAFGLFGNQNGQYYNATRSLSTGMGVGDTFSFWWSMLWDTGASGLNKGIEFRNGSTNIFSIQNSGTSSAITVGGVNTGFGYGGTPMFVTITRTSGSQYSVSISPDRDGTGSYSGTISSSSAIDGFNIYGSGNDNNGNRNVYYNNFAVTNTGVYFNTQTESRALTGTGQLVVSNNSTLTLISNGNTFTGGTTIQSGSTLSVGNGGGTGDIGGNIANSGTLNFNRNTNSFTYSGVISGSGAVNKTGAGGQINFSGANTYTGATTISGGSLEAQNASALGGTGTGTTVNNNAALRLWHSTGVTFDAEALSLVGSGVGSTGALFNAGGANTWAGAITLTGGTRIGADTGSTLNLSGGVNLSSTANTLYLGGAGNITIGSDLTNAGKTTVDGALYWDGTGALRFNQATQSGLTGNIALRSGTVLLGADTALGTGAVTVGAGSAITLASANTTARSIGNNITMSVSDRLNLGQSTTGTGNLTLGGTLSFGATGANHFLNVANSGTTVTINGIVSGTSKNLIKEGAGTLILSANNTYSGGTYIDAGTLVFSAGTSGTSGIDIGTTAGATTSAATLRLSGVNYTLTKNVLINTGGNRTIDFANSSGTATLDGTVVANKSFEVSVSTAAASGAITGAITGSGGLTKSGEGTLILSGANTFSGGTTVSAGTLQIGAGSTAGSISGNIANSGTVAFNRSDALSYSGVISGSGAVT
ncbi:hypothetical protein EBX31_10990, partial [bacterium]|nr:hypothetical protein [bacterium]